MTEKSRWLRYILFIAESSGQFVCGARYREIICHASTYYPRTHNLKQGGWGDGKKSGLCGNMFCSSIHSRMSMYI